MLYEQAGRPDLASEARLKYTDYLVKEGRCKEAAEGLAFTIKKFATEGRFVPKLLDKLEKVCKAGQFPDADGCLVRFYQQFLPLIPQASDGVPSPYCISIFKRAIALFKDKGQPDLAKMLELQLARLQGGRPH